MIPVNKALFVLFVKNRFKNQLIHRNHPQISYDEFG